MIDKFKVIGMWAVTMLAGNLLALGLGYGGMFIADKFDLYVRGIGPNTAGTPLSAHIAWGLVGFLALFNLLMGAVLVLLLFWLVGSVVGLLVRLVQHIYLRLAQTTGV